jgi:hypothetical protein
MAKFYGEVGYGDSVENPAGSGVWVDVITETFYFGDVSRKTRRLQNGMGLNDDIVVQNVVSIVADENAIRNFMKIKYVRWSEVNWTVTSVEVQSPRLVLSLGEVYNGPTP